MRDDKTSSKLLPCPYEGDAGCVLEDGEFGPCLCVNPVRTAARQDDGAVREKVRRYELETVIQRALLDDEYFGNRASDQDCLEAQAMGSAVLLADAILATQNSASTAARDYSGAVPAHTVDPEPVDAAAHSRCDVQSRDDALDRAELARQALRLLGVEDARQSKLHAILETIREQVRVGVAPEHRPDGLFRNIQDAVYAMRGRTPLLDDAALVGALDALSSLVSSADRESMARLSASEVACYRWPEDTTEHRAMRAAFCDGAALTVTSTHREGQ